MKNWRLQMAAGLVIFCFCAVAGAVETTYVTHITEKDFKAGEANGVLIDSEGVLSLGYANHKLFEQKDEIWVFNDMAAGADGVLYAASSPQGRVYKITAEGTAEMIYGDQDGQARHVFSLMVDGEGRLLMGTGGNEGLLLRRGDDGEIEQLFCHEDILYIWDIAVDGQGRIYLATGPKGQVIRLSPDGKETEFLYDAKEKNILTLALDEGRGVLYAGGDEFGLVYRIDLANNQTTIALDTGHEEIGKLLVHEASGNLYVATADPGAARMRKVLLKNGGPGRELKAEGDGNNKSEPAAVTPETLAEGAAEPSSNEKKSEPSARMPEFGKVRGANEVFEITTDGFIQSLLKLPVLFFDMAWSSHDDLLLATGNDGLVLRLNLANRQAVDMFDVEKADQVTALVALDNGAIYAGTANAAMIWRIEPDYLKEGIYESEAIDAQQVSRWGTMIFNLNAPAGTAVTLATRTGNTKDPDKGGWQDWSAEQDITATQTAPAGSPPGRFMQYRLKLTSADGVQTPEVTKVVLASRSPNLAPQVNAFEVVLGEKPSSKNKNPETWAINFKWNALDDNKDEMKFDLFLRPMGYEGWIRFAKDQDKPLYKWDSRTAADGEYEFKVTASDSPANAPGEALAGSRVSKITLIDNTPPAVVGVNQSRGDERIAFAIKVKDAFSPISGVKYNFDGGEQWLTASAEDGMFETPEETAVFTVEAEEQPHLLALQVMDERGNTLFYTITITQ